MAELHYLVLSALGPDRPGLVAEVTHTIAESGGNIEDSRMAVLGGEFGMIVLVSGESATLDTLRQGLRELEVRTGLGILDRPTISPETHRHRSSSSLHIIANALDHEGIVRAISTALYESGVNIITLTTTPYSAPETGTPLFRVEATVEMPRELSISDVHHALGNVAQTENLDIEIRALVS